MEAVVEFQAFKDNQNRFVLKELAVVSKFFTAHLVFNAPYSESYLNAKMYKSAKWLKNNFHCLAWGDEGIPYDEEWIRDLCGQFSVLHTKGEEKVTFLKQFHKNVQSIDESCSYSLGSTVTCILPQHNSGSGKCAMRSARAFYEFKFGVNSN